MKASFTVVPAIAMLTMTNAWDDKKSQQKQDPKVVRARAPIQIRWLPDWLLAPVERAIADANDPRDRSPKR